MRQLTGAQQAIADAEPARGMTGRALAVLLTATFMGQFDFFVVNVAAPGLQRDLHASGSLLQLVVGGYAFAYAAGLITGGRLGDLFGHRRVYTAGMVAFAVSSLACGAAQSPAELVIARLAQGLSAAAMLPQVLALITATMPAAARPRALGFFGLASGAGSVAAQVLGGALISADVAGLSWRVIFLINLPVAAVAVALATRWLPAAARRGGRPRLDPAGAAGTAAVLALALLPLTLGPGQGWPAWTWVALGTVLPAAALTGWWLQSLRRRGGQPVLDLSLLADPGFRAGLAANACFLAYFGSFMFILTLYLQDGLGLSALGAGLAFAPACVAFSASALAGPRLLRRYGQRAVVAGALITTAALAALAIAAGGRAGLPWIIVLITAGSLGNGVVLPALIGAALVTVPPQLAGAGAGALTTAQQFASSAGVAVVGTVFLGIAGRPAASAGRYPHAAAAALGIDLVLTAAVAALTGRAARHARLGRGRPPAASAPAGESR
ncbi:MAG TPA: MFS transporter [Streptosporangiaceae bacterium]|nr:MFS transporter [Streptosporangiaceae bacterium]